MAKLMILFSKQQNLTNYDLRASFVIVPTSPSLLDHLSNFSTWIPNGVDKPPARVYEYVQPD